MADNVDITAGSGTTIATDDSGTGHVQVVKLALSADGSRTPIGADADGLLVNLGANNDVAVTSAVTPTNQATTGSITSNGQSVTLAIPGCGTATVRVAGSFTGTLQIEGAADGSSYVNLSRITAVDGAVASSGITATGTFIVPCAGFTHVRVRASAFSSGQADITWTASIGSQAAFLAGPVPAGTNNIGDVDVLSLPALPAGTNNIGDVDVLTLPALPAGSNNIGDVDVLTVPSDPFGANADAASATGSISAKLRQLAANGIAVTSLPASTNTLEVVGDVAHSVAAAGNPIPLAGISQDMDDTAPPNQVDAEGDATRLSCDRDGGLFVHPHGPRIWSTVNTGSLSSTQVKGAPGAGLSLYVTAMQFSIGAATASSIKLLIAGGADIVGPHYLEAVNGRGLVIYFNPPLKVTANTALQATSTGATTCTLTTQGFTAP